MSNRPRLVGYGAALILLALIITGCGKAARVVAPDERGSSSTEVTDASLLASGETASSEARDDDREDGRRAVPISGQTTITKSGDYRLIRDLKVIDGDGIVITASHVRLWLDNHRLYGPGNKVGRAVVIDGAQDVMVRNGRIEHFGLGVVLIDASRCRVRDLEIQGGDETADPANGNPPQIGIMLINSSMSRIADNHLRGVNLGLFVRGGGSYGNSIRGNAVVGGRHGLLAICYNPAPGGDPAGPHDDRVRSNFLARFGTGIAASAGSAQNVFAGNTIRYFASAYSDQNGTNVFKHNRAVQITP